jgi:hypothetical protein
MEKADRDERILYLSRLALGTGAFQPPKTKEERHALDQFLLMYLDDSKPFPTAAVVEACERLRKRVQWFPKSSEFIEECRAVGRVFEERRESEKRRYLPDKPVSDEKMAEFMAEIRKYTRKRVIR